MKYVTGIHALNLTCDLLTCGDWHQSAIQWEHPEMADSEQMFFGEYGVESDRKIPCHEERFYAANHIRALLDLLEVGNFTQAQGMKEDFICNEDYTEEVLELVWKMKSLPHWEKIDRFMGKEYLMKWLRFKRRMEYEN